MDYRQIAEMLVEDLAPFCDRIEIGGSVRRGSPTPHDIEIVAVPSLYERTQAKTMFETETVTINRLDAELDEWLKAGRMAPRLDSRGQSAWGQRSKRANLITRSGHPVPVDLFSVLPPAQWGALFAIRTGPGDFNKLLVTSRLSGGVMPPDMQLSGGVLHRAGGALETPEEDAFFKEIGVPVWKPHLRTLHRLDEWRQKKLVSA